MRRFAMAAMTVALALVPAGVASAQGPYRERPTERGRYDRDTDRYDEGFYDRGGRRIHRENRLRWEPIVEQSSATSQRQFINVLGRGGAYRRLLVEGVRGAPVIERIAVEFTDRQTQVWDVNRRLTRGSDYEIRLGGPKRIHRIIVYTNPQFRGSYSIYGA
jgi:hypothetical protein